jgi:hypothetical protein
MESAGALPALSGVPGTQLAGRADNCGLSYQSRCDCSEFAVTRQLATLGGLGGVPDRPFRRDSIRE